MLTAIEYLVVEDLVSRGRGTLFHLLSEADVDSFRCLASVSLLPADTWQLEPSQYPFTAAIRRVSRLPQIRKAPSKGPLDDRQWREMIEVPLLILLVPREVPEWIYRLADRRDVGVLSHREEILSSLGKDPRFHTGLLKEGRDLHESYRVISELMKRVLTSDQLDEPTARVWNELLAHDLFEQRQRLAFLPALSLPLPWDGRPAAYLLNRLSNMVEQPSLVPYPESRAEGAHILPYTLDMAVNACAGLSMLETGREMPSSWHVPVEKLREYYDYLTSTDSPEKSARWWELVERVSRPGRKAAFICVPVPRIELLRKDLPTSLRPDSDHREGTGVKVQAVRDFVKGETRTNFKTPMQRYWYESIQETLLFEQRVLSLQSAWLAGSILAIPYQTRPMPGHLYAQVRDLNLAFSKGSPKISEMFNRLEAALGDALPPHIRAELAQGSAPVVFFSDLPYEWAAVNSAAAVDWPVCLSRPVSRVPVSFSHWDILSAIAQGEIAIDRTRPDRVLILDLIEASDPVRLYTDRFIAISESLDQRYSYARPATAEELSALLRERTPDIIVVDAHGRYDSHRDEVRIALGRDLVNLDEVLPPQRTPPVWILSACAASVPGAIRGTVVRQLLSRGAICVIAALHRIDAFTAAIFVGRLLTEIFSPVRAGMATSFLDVFFNTQFTTAVLYDPLLPLIRQGESVQEIGEAVTRVIRGYWRQMHGRDIDPKVSRIEAANRIGELLAQEGLADRQRGLAQAGRLTPETLLFTAFGLPHRIGLTSGRAHTEGSRAL